VGWRRRGGEGRALCGGAESGDAVMGWKGEGGI